MAGRPSPGRSGQGPHSLAATPALSSPERGVGAGLGYRPPTPPHQHGRLDDEHTGRRMIRIIAALIAGIVLVVTVQRTWAGAVYALLSRGDR